jgi:hypothetical protein
MRSAAIAIVAVLLGGCGATGATRGTPATTATTATTAPAPAPFVALPVRATVVPASGGIHQVFHVRFPRRQPTGVRGHVIRGYEARLRHTDEVACIIDTGGFLNPRGKAGIVLDPSRMMGQEWCRGRFHGTLSYYAAYACPDHGTCHIPRGFPEHERTVARLAFTVR